MGDVKAGDVLGDAAGGALAGASVGSYFGPWGTLIGGGVGAIGGGLAGLFSDLSAPDQSDIYNQLMSQYASSPAYQQQQAALAELKGQTVSGPTAQETAQLQLALQAANKQFAGSYGAIQQGLAARGGVGASTQAALLAAQGQGQAGQMSNMAMQAASAEDARKQQAIQAYTQATNQAQQMQQQYQQWASGQAYGQATNTEAFNNQAIGKGEQAIGSIGATIAGPGGMGSKSTPTSNLTGMLNPTPSITGGQPFSNNSGGAGPMGSLPSWDAAMSAPTGSSSPAPAANYSSANYSPVSNYSVPGQGQSPFIGYEGWMGNQNFGGGYGG